MVPPEAVLSHTREFDDPFSTAGDMKYHFQNLLDSKEKQLQQAGSLGQRVLDQCMELEEKIRQLQVLEADKDEIDLKAHERYCELVEIILTWDSENVQLFNAFAGSLKAFEVMIQPPKSVSSHMHDFDHLFSTTGGMKQHLQNFLSSKEKQLQQASNLGHRIMAQQIKLDEYIRQLQELEVDKGEDEGIGLETREQYRELSETTLAWDSDKTQLSSAFAGSLKAFEAMIPPPKSVLSHRHPFSTAGDIKYHLQNFLDSKEKQLQQAGHLGQRVLAQQMELEEHIRQLIELEADKGDDDEVDLEARERYRELAKTILAWDSENMQFSSTFVCSSKPHPPSVPYDDLSREEPERAKTPTQASTTQSRRAKNAAHCAYDVEFAFEIGSGLLTEVGHLQSLLGEWDKSIQDMKEDKDDLEKTVEAIRTNLRQQEQSSDKYKEENWNLEVALQELHSQLSDTQATTQRLESEHKRFTKALALARDHTDQYKIESQKLQCTLQELKYPGRLAGNKSGLQQN